MPHGGDVQCRNPVLCAAFYNPPVILNRAAVKNPVNRTPKPQNTGSFTPFRMTEYFFAGGLCWTWPEADTAVIGRFVNRPYEWVSEYGSRGASRSARVGCGRKPKKRWEQALPCEDAGTLSARDAVSVLVGINGGGHAGDQQHHIVVIGF